MQRLRIFFLVCVLELCSGSGCTNPIAPIDTPQELIPLKIGNEWNYEVANYLPAFNDTLYRQYSSRIISDTLIEGKKHFVVNTYSNFLISAIVINFSDGYYIKQYDKYAISLKYPVRLGDKYRRIITDTDKKPVDTLNIEITALDKQIIVQAGKFQCYEEQYSVGSDKYVSHIAPGHGWIEGLIYDSTATLVARTQLTSYTLQK